MVFYSQRCHRNHYVFITNKPKGRNRQAAAKIAQFKMKNTLIQMLGKNQAKELFKNDHAIPGEHQRNTFDVAISNGQPFFAAHAISFEVQTPTSVRDSLAWIIFDVKKYSLDFPLAIITLLDQIILIIIN